MFLFLWKKKDAGQKEEKKRAKSRGRQVLYSEGGSGKKILLNPENRK